MGVSMTRVRFNPPVHWELVQLAARVNVFIGCWLIAAPWILHFASSPATINFLIVEVLVGVLALYELWRGAAEKQPKHD
jgi:hypothetical protein